MDEKVCVIGLGEVGEQTFLEIAKKNPSVFGVDINPQALQRFKERGFSVGSEIPICDVYIICVYLTEQVLSVLQKIRLENNPLLVVESTIQPKDLSKIVLAIEKRKKPFDLVFFPHRFNPKDPAHHVFNLDRVMGGKTASLERAVSFYSQFMNPVLIHRTSPEIAALCKPFENAYRFMEIAIAEELKMVCDEKGVSFEELRAAMNTKWNICVMEARDGIKGKCLPKDTELMMDFFPKSKFLKAAWKTNQDYTKKQNRKK